MYTCEFNLRVASTNEPQHILRIRELRQIFSNMGLKAAKDLSEHMVKYYSGTLLLSAQQVADYVSYGNEPSTFYLSLFRRMYVTNNYMDISSFT